MSKETGEAADRRRRYARLDREVAKAARPAGDAQAAKSAELLKAQDKRFRRIGGRVQQEWMESPDRVRLVLAAGTEAAKSARGRYDEYATGINTVKLAKDVDRELRKQVPQAEQARQAEQAASGKAYLEALAKSGDKRAQAELDRTRADDPELLVYLDGLAKSGPTTPDGRRAQDLLDEKAREALERRRGQGWSR